MSLRRELWAAGGFAFGLLGLFLAFVHRGDLLVAPFAAVGAALLPGAVLAIRERPRSGSRLRRLKRQLSELPHMARTLGLKHLPQA